MAVKIQKLDGRFDGHEHFKYRAVVYGPAAESNINFAIIRSWMIDTYGKSNELELHNLLTHYESHDNINTKWSWKYSTDYGRYIYLQDDKILSWFTLKWVGE